MINRVTEVEGEFKQQELQLFFFAKICKDNVFVPKICKNSVFVMKSKCALYERLPTSATLIVVTKEFRSQT